MKKIIFIATTIIISFTLISHAITSKEIIENTLKKYEEIVLLSADIQQTRFISTINKKSIYMGKIYLSHPNKFRIEYTKPREEVIVCDGDSIWIYSIENEQVLVQSAKGSENFVFHYLKNSDSKLTSLNEKINGNSVYLLNLVPLDNSSPDVQSLRTWIDKKSWLPLQIEITDINGNIVIYTLKNIQIDNKLDDKLFDFVIPKDVDIFRE